MPDITACSNANCNLRNSCFRYRCVKSAFQSFSFMSPEEENFCFYYWNISEATGSIITVQEADAQNSFINLLYLEKDNS